jgi:dynein heavy chain
MIYMTGHINYGGRVTDDWDRVCLLSILKKYYTIEALTDKYCFSESETYFIPNCYTIEDFRLAIETLPNQDDPVVFGLHDNANLIFMGQESNKIIETILSLEAASSAKSETSPDAQVLATITNLSNLPAAMPTSILKDHLKGDADSVILPSLTTFLLQEVTKFNNLLNVMKNSLVQLEMAIKGLVVMSQELDEMYTSFLNNTVPNLWKKVAYSSLKPLSSWIKDLKERVLFISDWFLKQLPNGYWMSGFFFPQGFLTGVLQTHARKYKIPIDTLAFKYRTTDT